MAVSTHLGLYLPTREDYISVKRDISDNMEAIDEAIGMLQNGSAIIVDGDDAPQAITSGQYLLIKNHSTLATGGYHATSNIGAGVAIDSTNVAADNDGIFNSIKSNISAIKNQLGNFNIISIGSFTSANKTKTFTMTNYSIAMFLVVGTSNDGGTLYIVTSRGSGAIAVSNIGNINPFTFTRNDTTVTMTSSGGTLNVYALCMDKSISNLS